ncbi:TonB-dependent siderophore receptor [Ectothiorhodospiraceae bacterium 2226]|nr:TonB-dependent siderophore receptor [Ectothiorhodospiraceae bacterium 2226]
MSPSFPRRTLAASIALLCAPSLAFAQSALPRIDVIGGGEAVERTPGSAQVIQAETLERDQPVSTQDALRRVSGINVVETDGYGLFPRIGVRGLNPDMSKKVLLLEDGAPIALGPYTDPAAYYSPPVERMERIEVLKGSGSLRYGPSTIGGAINYVTKDPSLEPGGAVTLRGGSDAFGSLMLDYGGTWDNASASVSLLRKQGDGWRENSQFETNDLVLKSGFGMGPDQFLGFKFTYYDSDQQATYLGLTQREFEENHLQNRAENDWINVRRYSFDVNHEWQLSPHLTWRTLVYTNQADRDWWRQSFAFDAASGYNELQDENAGRLRNFRVGGIDTRLEVAHQTFGVDNELDLGVRLHTETLDNQRVDGASATARSGTIREDDVRRADAAAVFAQNRFNLTERWAVTPGMRVETYEQRRTIHRWDGIDQNTASASRNTEVIPGVGTTYRLADATTVFAGVHRGFAPPRVQDAIANDGEAADLEAERSTNYEIGVRGQLDRVRYEVAAFRYDFTNQLVQSSEAGGTAATQLTNAGETLNQGIELSAGLPLFGGLAFDVNYTWVADAKLTSTRIIGGVDREGNRLPYAPEHLLNATLSYTQGPWSGAVQASYVGEQYADFENTEAPTADGRRGLIPSYTVWNLSAGYQVSGDTRLFGTVKNVFDEKYIASRAPQGIFPGMARQVMVGLESRF